MYTRLDKNPLFRFLTNPEPRYRIARHVLLWVTAIFVIYKRFEFNAVNITSSADKKAYIEYSTFVFGGVTILDYLLIVVVIRQFMLRRFQFGQFMLGLLGVHLVTATLVRWHMIWFAQLFAISNLPIAYQIHADHVINLSMIQAPFDSVVVGIFCFSLVYSYLLYVLSLKVFKDLFVLRINESRLEKENLKLEYQFLKAQINPHFLFNTLNNIYSYSIKSPEKVPDTILKLADLMRYTLYETESEFVPLNKELLFLESYVQLQRIRHETDTDLSFTVQGQPGELLIAPLVLIVFVENAFKHGAQASIKSARVHIVLIIKEGMLSFKVVNSIAAHHTMVEWDRGIGIKNVRKRLNLYYPGRHDLQINRQADEFQVNLEMNLYERTV